MSPTLQSLGLDKLSVEERQMLIDQLLASFHENAESPFLTNEKRAELDRRLAEHAANPNDLVPWERVKAEALARLTK